MGREGEKRGKGKGGREKEEKRKGNRKREREGRIWKGRDEE